MKAQTKTAARTDLSLASIAFVALLGVSVLFIAGFANSAAVHDAAHDTRHAAGFPCH